MSSVRVLRDLSAKTDIQWQLGWGAVREFGGLVKTARVIVKPRKIEDISDTGRTARRAVLLPASRLCPSITAGSRHPEGIPGDLGHRLLSGS